MRFVCISILFLTAVCLVAGTSMAGSLYKWVDANGVLHVSDTPPPPGTTDKVEQIGEITSPPPPPAKPQQPEQTKKTAQVKKPAQDKKTVQTKTATAPRVTIYTTEWCGYCRKAIAFFKQRGIAFTEHDIEKDPEAAKRRRRLHTRSGVPLAVINGVAILGFNPNAYVKALNKR